MARNVWMARIVSLSPPLREKRKELPRSSQRRRFWAPEMFLYWHDLTLFRSVRCRGHTLSRISVLHSFYKWKEMSHFLLVRGCEHILSRISSLHSFYRMKWNHFFFSFRCFGYTLSRILFLYSFSDVHMFWFRMLLKSSVSEKKDNRWLANTCGQL